jgi:hypothetical protein
MREFCEHIGRADLPRPPVAGASTSLARQAASVRGSTARHTAFQARFDIDPDILEIEHNYLVNAESAHAEVPFNYAGARFSGDMKRLRFCRIPAPCRESKTEISYILLASKPIPSGFACFKRTR